ncbi:MAG: xanthine dehydrogenase family protein molybdopterin-binding subunit [Anaerolineae bacterium]|nr:xanthine dehydrogenase family protein molybdopterin-binding subunit [Anaerolineae bacterium]
MLSRIVIVAEEKSRTIAIGQNMHRIDAHGKVTGETPYPGDFEMDGQLWMKIRFSDRAHARVLHIDTSKAVALPGVHGVFTAADVPVNEYGLVTKDQPVLCGPGSPMPGADVVRCYMDMVALVVAESEALAAQAARLIEIEYEDLPPVFEAHEAMESGAPQLHERYPKNTLCHFRIRKGDMAAGWAAADVVVEGAFSTGYQEHAFLQPEAGISYIDEQGRVTVVVAGQWAHEDQELICHALDLPPEQVRVIYPAIGGAFGGREDMSVQIILALAAWKLHRPVKIVWSREESIQYHHKRHPVYIKLKWGARKDGTITAMHGEVIGDAGAYNYTTSKVLGNANLMITGPYECENVHTDTYGVVTNNIPTGAFRGFGAPQACFAAETLMNQLAEKLGIDPVALRLKNCVHEGSYLSVGTPLPAGVSMDRVIEACAHESGWTNDVGHWIAPSAHGGDLPPHLRRGIGFACGFKNVGFSFGFPEQSWATVEIHGNAEIERVVVRHAGAEVGQGTHTVMVQMAAEGAGVPVEKVELIGHDTAETKTSGSASASRLTFMAGNAIKGAAERALAQWKNEERPAIATYQYRPPKTTPYDPETGRSEPNFAYGYVAQAAEVLVDVETGHIQVVRVISANDVGRAINPQLVQGQIEGAVVQALGYTIMEHLISKDGRILNPYLSTYLIPTVLDVPLEVKSIILEYADPIGPWGARGMAEMPFIPVAPAIVAAVRDATGIWFHDLPLIPEKVVARLRAVGIGVL